MFSKKLLLCLALLCTVGTYGQLPLTNLSAWYPFCGNTLDKSGNTNDLTNAGPVLTTDRFGNTSSAYHFSGSTVWGTNIMTHTPPMPDSGDFTMAVWVMADTGGNQVLLANGNININGYGLVTTGHNVAVAIGGVGNYLPTYLPYHEWHHILVKRQGSTYSLYIDTMIVGAFTSAYNPALPGQQLAAGQDQTTGMRSFTGKMDDIAIYTRALPDSDIRKLYHFNPDVHAVLGPDAAVCAGFSTTLAPSPQYPGLNYTWSNGSTDSTIVADTFGTYWFSISRPYGCTTSDSITYTLGIVSVSLGRDTAVCVGDTFVLVPSAPAGSTFLWNTGDTTSTLHLTAPGSYSVAIDNAGCPGYDTMTFTYSPIPAVDLGHDTSICSIVPVTLTSAYTYPGAAYQWNTGTTTAVIHPSISGRYILRVLVDGCPGYDTVNLHFIVNPTVFLGPDRTVCQGDSLTLSGSGLSSTDYLWSTGDTVSSITIKTTGVYWLTAVDSGCVATDTMKYTVYPYPAVHLGPDVSVCQGVPVILSSSDTYTAPIYLWNTGASTATLNVTTSGTYTLTVRQNGCAASDAINVTIKPNPIVSLGNDTYFCTGTSFSLSSVQPAGAVYTWSNGATTSSINITSPGLYGLFVDLNGCYGSDSIVVDEIHPPAVNLGQDTTICQGFVIGLAVNGDLASYLWSDGSTATTYDVNTGGAIWARVTNVCGSATDTVNVTYKFCDIWLPTAFSPNGDGRNDLMRVKGTLGAYSQFHFAIFNRWGVNVYVSDDINAGWDGTYNNEPQPIGTYFYLLTSTLDGKTYNMKGDFQLVR